MAPPHSTTQEVNEVEKKDDATSVVVLSKKELWAVLKRVLSFTSPDILNLGLGTISLFINSLTNLYFPYAIGKIVDSATQRCTLTISDMEGPSLFFVSGAIASFVRVYNFGLVKENCANRLKTALVSNCLDQDLIFFDKIGTGELLTTLEKDVNVTAEIVADKIPGAIRSCNSAFLGSMFLFRMSPYLCGVSLLTIPVVGIVTVALGKTSAKLTSSLRELEKRQSLFVSERFRNISTVFVNDMQCEERKIFGEFSKSIQLQSKTKYFINGVRMSFVNIATNASIIAVLYAGSRMVGSGEITQGELTSFLMRSGFVGLGFSAMSSVFTDIRTALASASRREDVASTTVLDEKIPTSSKPVEDDPMAMSCYVDLSIPVPEGSPISSVRHLAASVSSPPIVTFQNVTFSYPSRPERPCLKSVSLDIFNNRLTAIAGRSGAGKSSMAALMCSLYKPLSGELHVCGKRVAMCTDEDVKVLRKKVSVVEQSPVLFSGSIAYNIGYGMPHASREDIEDAARMAFSHEFIASMADGYDTQVGEGGTRLSGGQRQRIALCRALLHETEILVLDEPSSSLDCENEDSLIRLLLSLKKTKCIVVFTHSLSLMAAADELHVLDDGVVVESGTYSSLKNSDRVKYVLQSATEH